MARAPKPKARSRAREKQAARDAQDRAIAEGRLTEREAQERNAFLRADRTIVHWKRAKPL